jgi:chromosome partitioning protein
LHGLGKLLETTTLVAKRLNAHLRVTGIILCLYESNTRLAQEVQRDLEAYLDRSQAVAVPWKDARVFQTRIRRNIKLAESPSFGRSIFEYAPGCNGADDYQALALEVLGEAAPEVFAARMSIDADGEVRVVEAPAEQTAP